jgi:hypothetical protein
MDDRAVLQRLVDELEIRRLRARYPRLLDTRQFDELRTLFTDDATFGTPSADSAGAHGPDEFVAALEASPYLLGAVHHLYEPEIEITSDLTARGLWSVTSVVSANFDVRDGALVPVESDEPTVIYMYGHYEDEYRKVDGAWKISSLQFRIADILRLDRVHGETLLSRAPHPAPRFP